VLVARFPVSVGVVLGVALTVTGAFVFSLPMLEAPVDETMLSSPRHFTVAQVRRTFRDYGIRLRYASHPRKGLVVLGATLPPWPATSLHVAVGERVLPTGLGYERRVGNVLVHYGGSNERVLARVKAAVAALHA
jgi:hypothetical protein